MARSVPERRLKGYLAAGCLLLLVLIAFLVAAAGILAFNRDRRSAQYPGSREVTRHSNYSGIPGQVRWDNSYFTTDPFTDVYNWYSVRYSLGAESRALERCILLEGPIEEIFLERTINVLICGTDNGQLVYVSQSFELRSLLELRSPLRLLAP